MQLSSFTRFSGMQDDATDGTDPSMGEAPRIGIIAGTRVATTIGWRPIEEVKPGERVLTFDGGLQEVARVDRSRLWARAKACPRRHWPLHVPVDALGNQTPMQLLPDQPVMLESDAAEDIFGDPFTLMPAAALEGFRGIRRELPDATTEIVTLFFEEEQVVFANIGALFLCPADVSAVDEAHGRTSGEVYSMLPLEKAADLTRMIAREESRAAENAFADQ